MSENSGRKDERGSEAGGTILIVEDQAEIIEPLEYSLRKAGFATLVAQDGVAACRMIGEHNPHLVLLDILLPLLDGWEVCRLVRSLPDPQAASVPIIMLTALSAPQEKFRGLELGADAYLRKPFSVREVVLLARRMVERRRQQLALKEEVETLRTTETLHSDLQSALFHELRNQLWVIAGFADVLGQDLAGVVFGQARDCTRIIRNSASYLASLAGDLLLVRQVENANIPLPRERVNIFEVLKEIVLLHHDAAKARNISLTLQERGGFGRVQANRAGCRIALSNLVDNAIKYSRPGGSVRIAVEEPNSGGLIVEVADSGPGIPEEERERIFERFFRSSRHEETVFGAGLGLYAARALVEAMGGRLFLARSGDQGSLFRVEFKP